MFKTIFSMLRKREFGVVLFVLTFAIMGMTSDWASIGIASGGFAPIVFGTTSNAFSGVGTSFKRSNMLATPTFSAIAEINSIDGPNKSRATIDVTSLDSTGGYKEFIAGFRDAGEISLDMNFTEATFNKLNDDFESEALVDYRIVLPDTSNTTFDFSGIVTSMGMSVPLDDKVTSKVAIKISGPVTLTT